MGFAAALGGGLNLLRTIGGIGLGIGQLIKARQYRMERPEYQIPGVVGEQLGLRQQLLNARMPGAQQAEQNIMASQQGAMYNVAQGATDSASILAAAAGAQGTTNKAMRDLSIQESQDYYNRLAGLESAQQNMATYEEKQFADQMAKYQEMQQARAALTESGIQNIFGGAKAGEYGAGMAGQIEAEGGENPYSAFFDMFRRSPRFGQSAKNPQ